MSGLDTRRLVLVESTLSASDGKESFVYGTGYFVTDSLVLTAHHVLSKGVPKSVRVRVEEGKSQWREAMKEPAWQDESLDAALLCVNESLKNIDPPTLDALLLDEDRPWNSTAYPKASSQAGPKGVEYSTSGLNGICYAHGGKGQGLRELELSVNAEPEDDEGWKGISGAPVFIGDALVGVIKSFPRAYRQKRLHAVPMDMLLQEPGFRLAIAPRWLEPFPDDTWILVLTSEGEAKSLANIVRGAIKKHEPRIRETLHLTIDTEPKVVSVNEALESPERWLSFVRAMCVAPVMITDVTDFQEGMMALLGIRSVVRRGVTITSTAKEITESELSSLPFNIQETKLICHANPKKHEFNSKSHPTNLIADSILHGLQQLQTHPGYLDLPAYDAVRCQQPQSLETILMLCPFTTEWTDKHFQDLANAAAIEAAGRDPVRMLDLPSPRLACQVLYEHVRWATYCIVDWSRWRPNVFFELGVRLASSDVGPICLIDANDKPLDDGEPGRRKAGSEDKDQQEAHWVNQRRQLIRLFRPREYTLDAYSEPVKAGFLECNKIIDNKAIDGEDIVDRSALRHDDTYRTIVDAYDWTQDRITLPPHQALRASIESLIGKDPQQTGNKIVLYSARKEFDGEIASSIRERWIAAWYYLRYRYSSNTFGKSEVIRDELSRLSETVLQNLPKVEDERYSRIRQDINEIKIQLGKLASPQLE